MKRRHQHQLPPPRRRSERLRAQSFPRVLDALRPILPLFHSFLTDDVAACLLRTSRTTALILLSSYTFTSHIFQPASLVSLRRLRDLCLTYNLRMTQVALSQPTDDIGFDAAPPRLSPIPDSVLALSLYRPELDDHLVGLAVSQSWAAFSCAASDWQHREAWRLPSLHPSSQSLGEEGKQWQLTWEVGPLDVVDCFLPRCPTAGGSIDCPLPRGLLPWGLRVFRCAGDFSQPLQLGSLPPYLTFAHFGWRFQQPLTPGLLPASLLALSISAPHCPPLVKGSLPASLERLRLSVHWSPPLEVGVLPRTLKALHLGGDGGSLQPAVLPPSLLFLSFEWHQHPLLPNVLPSSLVHLRLGAAYNHPLPPGVLPSSLRVLSLGDAFCQPLQVGSLPEGLLFFRLEPQGLARTSSLFAPLHPGVLPSTLLGIDLADRCERPIPAGVFPSGVRWIRLSTRYRDQHIEAALPPHAECTGYSFWNRTSWHIV